MKMTDKKAFETLVRIEERLTGMATQLDKIEHVVLGNGRPGLVEKVAKLEERVGLSLLEKITLYGGGGSGLTALIHTVISHLT